MKSRPDSYWAKGVQNYDTGKMLSQKSKKGKGSLKSTGKNEGENMMMGKNGTQRA